MAPGSQTDAFVVLYTAIENWSSRCRFYMRALVSPVRSPSILPHADEFQSWLARHVLTGQSARDVATRTIRAFGLADLAKARGAGGVARLLCRSPEYRRLRKDIRSQLKRSATLYLQFCEERKPSGRRGTAPAELRRRLAWLEARVAERERIARQLDFIERQLAIAQGTPGFGPVPRGDLSLAGALRVVLKGRALSAREAREVLRRVGYSRASEHPSFRAHVSRALGDRRLFTRTGGRMDAVYTARW
jgi:hypothetical protein